MIWFTSDLHLGHAKIIEYSRRPFANVDEMNAALVNNWNALVKPNDSVWVLGDFAMKEAWVWVPKLNGTKFLVIGNHDRDGDKDLAPFAAWFNVKQIMHRGHKIWLSHYAHRVWPSSHRGALHLYGHSHGQLSDPGNRSMDVGVDCHGFKPISADEVLARLLPRQVPALGPPRFPV